MKTFVTEDKKFSYLQDHKFMQQQIRDMDEFGETELVHPASKIEAEKRHAAKLFMYVVAGAMIFVVVSAIILKHIL